MLLLLLQTVVCMLLVNTGLYALHLTGSSTSTISGPGSAQLKKSSVNHFQSTSNRLNEELPDLAQLERERLMVMGLAKQTAEESGYHGRPIITGRIKMHPAEDVDSEYSTWLNQQARNVMYGNVIKEPLNDEEDYETDGGGSRFNSLRPQTKYQYGRVIQPMDGEREFENPHNLDLDEFTELEPVNDMDEDMFPDMDGYAYLEELLAEENKEKLQHHYQQQQLQQQQQQHQRLQHQQMPQFPGFRQAQQQHHIPLTHSSFSQYQNYEPMDESQETVHEFLEKEENLKNLNHQQQQQAQQFNNKYRNNIRMQQKWLRKRNQLQQRQQQQLTRNIFGQKNAKVQQPSIHHFKSLSNNKLALANSEATATTRINTKQEIAQHEQQQQQLFPNIQNVNFKESNNNINNNNNNNREGNVSNLSTKTEKSSSSASVGQKSELLQHPNHKRSGLTPASLASSAGVSSPHSLASQLMLRTARGQRQYDVPQIECPTAMDGMERFACPTPDVQGRYRCIDDHVLCDGFIDCPEGEDEDRRSCMFYKTTKAHLDVLADALLRWARGR